MENNTPPTNILNVNSTPTDEDEYYDEEGEYGDEYYDEETPVDESYSFREVQKYSEPITREEGAIISQQQAHHDSMMSKVSSQHKPGPGGSITKKTSTSHS